MELGILGLLWCDGTNEEKAHVFVELVDPNPNPYIERDLDESKIAWNDKEMKSLISTLFYFSNEMTSQHISAFQNDNQLKPPSDQNNTTDQHSIKLILEKHQGYYNKFYEEKFVNPIFGEESLISAQTMIEKLC